jgi:uncharacterized protein (DUF736 family)
VFEIPHVIIEGDHQRAPEDVCSGHNRSMRKRILGTNPSHGRANAGHGWFNLEQIATVEVTSEDPGFPIDSVFAADSGSGWRASQKGEQQIRIIFDQPLSVHRIQLRFLEPEHERTQEFTIRWSSADGGLVDQIVRQQWNFSPAGSTSEVEDYEVDLDGVSVLELVIKPDLTRGEAPATLASWRVACTLGPTGI